MKLNSFEVVVQPGQEQNDGYVVMRHGAQYTLLLANIGERRADAVVTIDGKHVGTWRVDPMDRWTIERPVDDLGKFTFYRLGTSEAKSAEIKRGDNTGLITVVFKPEVHIVHLQEEIGPLFQRRRGDSRAAGGTGLSGLSKQKFRTVEAITHAPDAEVTIHLRLITDDRDDNRPRPLKASRSTPVPPPIC